MVLPSGIDGSNPVMELIAMHLEKPKNMKRQLAQELERKKYELNSAVKAKQELTAELNKKDNCLDHLKTLNKVLEQTYLNHNLESESLREEIDTCNNECDKILYEFQTKSDELSDRFTSAPENYAIQKITDEIEMKTLDAEDFSNEIQSKWNPDISASKNIMENEPVTVLEDTESSLGELSANAFDALITKKVEMTVEKSHIVDKLKHEKIVLENEENSLQ